LSTERLRTWSWLSSAARAWRSPVAMAPSQAAPATSSMAANPSDRRVARWRKNPFGTSCPRTRTRSRPALLRSPPCDLTAETKSKPKATTLTGSVLRRFHHSQIGQHRLEAAELLVGLLVGDGGRQRHVLARLPVRRRRYLVLGGKLDGIERAEDLVEIPSCRHRVGERQFHLLVGPDDEHGAHRLVVGRRAALGTVAGGGGQHVVKLGDLEVLVADHRIVDLLP